MSSSRHPRALSLERHVGDPGRLLTTVMLLPLVDGIFPALVLAGTLNHAAGIVEVGLLVFGGSATVAVILAEMDGSRQEQLRVIAAVGVVLVGMAIIEAALAPTIDTIVDLAVFERFAGLVILAVAASTASARVAEYIPRPGVIVALGFIASVDLGGASLVLSVDPELMLRAGAAGGVGVIFAGGVAIAGPWLRNAVDIDRFRFGSAVALGVLALSIFGVVPTEAPIALAVLAVTALLAFDPGRAQMPEWEYHPDDIDITAALADGGASPAVDGGPGVEPATGNNKAPAESSEDEESAGPSVIERAPWL